MHRDRARLDPVAPLQAARGVRPPGELLGVAQAGQDVREVGGQLQVAALHGLGELAALCLRRLLEEALHGPQALGLPAEARLGRHVLRLREERERVAEVRPLLALHLRLRVGVADVHVRVGDDVERARRHRAQGHRARPGGCVPRPRSPPATDSVTPSGTPISMRVWPVASSPRWTSRPAALTTTGTAGPRWLTSAVSSRRPPFRTASSAATFAHGVTGSSKTST